MKFFLLAPNKIEDIFRIFGENKNTNLSYSRFRYFVYFIFLYDNFMYNALQYDLTSMQESNNNEPIEEI